MPVLNLLCVTKNLKFSVMNKDTFYTGNTEQLSGLVQNSTLIGIYIATGNCSTCEVLRPKVQSFFTTRFSQIPLLIINAEDYPEWVAGQMIFSAPVLLLYAFGKEFYRGSRYLDFTELENKIRKTTELIGYE